MTNMSIPPEIDRLLNHRLAIDPLTTPIEEQERRERDGAMRRIQELRSLTAASRQVLQILNHPGYKGFCTEVQKLRDEANRALINGIRDEEMHREQGKVIALDAILTILVTEEANLNRLAAELQEAENRYRDTVMADGRLKPKGLV